MPPKKTQPAKAKTTTIKITGPKITKSGRVSKPKTEAPAPTTAPRTTRRTRNRTKKLEEVVDLVDPNTVNVTKQTNDPMDVDAIDVNTVPNTTENAATNNTTEVPVPDNTAQASSTTNTGPGPSNEIQQEDVKLPHKLRYLCNVPLCRSGAYGFGELCKHFRKAHRDIPEPESDDTIQKVEFTRWLNDEVKDYPATKQAKTSYPQFLYKDSVVPEITETTPVEVKQPSKKPAAKSKITDPAPVEVKQTRKRSTAKPKITVTAPVEVQQAEKTPTAEPEVSEAATEPVVDIKPVPKRRTRVFEPAAIPNLEKIIEILDADTVEAIPDPKPVQPVQEQEPASREDRNWRQEAMHLAMQREQDLITIRDAEIQLEAARRYGEHFRGLWDRQYEENQALLQILERYEPGIENRDFKSILSSAYKDQPEVMQQILQDDAKSAHRLERRAKVTVARQEQDLDENLAEIPDEDDNRSEVMEDDFGSMEDSKFGYSIRAPLREWHVVKKSILGSK